MPDEHKQTLKRPKRLLHLGLESGFPLPGPNTLHLWKYDPIQQSEEELVMDPINLRIVNNDDEDDPRIEQAFEDVDLYISTKLKNTL